MSDDDCSRPSIPSTSEMMGYTLPSSSEEESPRDRARALMEKKQNIEAELEAQLSVLNANNNCGMDTPLVDRDGFPRADIDVWAVRNARVRIIELRNDLNAVMNAIAKALEGVFDPNLTQPLASEEPLKPFARVNTVSPGSPSSQAVSCVCQTFDMYMCSKIHIIGASIRRSYRQVWTFDVESYLLIYATCG
jgi:hypothetical protein